MKEHDYFDEKYFLLSKLCYQLHGCEKCNRLTKQKEFIFTLADSAACDKKRNFLIVRIEKKRINSRLIFWLVGD